MEPGSLYPFRQKRLNDVLFDIFIKTPIFGKW